MCRPGYNKYIFLQSYEVADLLQLKHSEWEKINEIVSKLNNEEDHFLARKI